MKLTPKLKEILVLMKSGWQLGKSKALSCHWWLQKDGCGKGGEAKIIDGRVRVINLWREKLIESDGYGFPTETYHLTEKGKRIVNELSS